MLSSVISLKRGPEESDEVQSKKLKEDSSAPVKTYSMHSRPSSQVSSTKSTKKNSEESEDVDEDDLLNLDNMPDVGEHDMDNSENFLNDNLLMGDDSSSVKPKGTKRVSPPHIMRPRSASEESKGDNMWSNEFADNDDMNPEGEDDYFGKENQVVFTSNEEGANIYEVGYMSTVSYDTAQQQQIEMGILKPKPISTPAALHFHKQSGVYKLIATPAAPNFHKQSGHEKGRSLQESVAVPVSTKGHGGSVETNTITTRGSQQKSSSNHAALKGDYQNLSESERVTQQKSGAPKNKPSGNEKKSNQVSTSQTTSTSVGARGVETTKDVIDPDNIATHPIFYGTKFVNLNP